MRTGRAQWLRGVFVALVIAGLGSARFTALPGTRAASAFADPAFQTQWMAGEALTPNFWGPLANAHPGMPEPWKEGTNGQRTVQYFDKGRMERGSGVTSGLLATELITGKIQTGTNTFEAKRTPAMPIAGDPQTPGPTFAAFGGPAAPLLAPTTEKTSGLNPPGVTTALATDGTITAFMPGADYALAVPTDFDGTTNHNVVRAFATYRDKAGFLNIGYAITEPFWATVLVRGQQTAVLIQVFERRVLTYTAQNPPGFEVEMGNIGAQYYRWRYESADTTSTATSATTVVTSTGAAAMSTATTTATINASGATATRITLAISPTPLPTSPLSPTPTMGSVPGTPLSSVTAVATNRVAFLNPPATIARGTTATVTVAAPAGASCTIVVMYKNGASHDNGLTDKTVAPSSTVSWTWFVGSATAPGPAPINVICTVESRAYTVSATTVVTA